jgi:hypothetical protein
VTQQISSTNKTIAHCTAPRERFEIGQRDWFAGRWGCRNLSGGSPLVAAPLGHALEFCWAAVGARVAMAEGNSRGHGRRLVLRARHPHAVVPGITWMALGQYRVWEVRVELVVWVGSGRNWQEHAVTLDQMSAAVVSGRGVYSALCGERFVPLPMLSGPCPRCHRCLSLSSVRSRRPRQAHGRLWVRWSTYRRSVRQALQSIAPTERPGL